MSNLTTLLLLLGGFFAFAIWTFLKAWNSKGENDNG